MSAVYLLRANSLLIDLRRATVVLDKARTWEIDYFFDPGGLAAFESCRATYSLSVRPLACGAKPKIMYLERRIAVLFLKPAIRYGRFAAVVSVAALASAFLGCGISSDAKSAVDCVKVAREGFRPIAADREHRFLGKVQEDTSSCRGGDLAVRLRPLPSVDWRNYWGTGDSKSQGPRWTGATSRGVDGALVDLEYQRIELIKFNLFDNNQTFEQYLSGRDGLPGPSLKVWPEMRLPSDNPNYQAVGGDGAQLCRGELIRYRTLTGICNDIRNPSMGSTGALFSRMVEFSSTFPDLGRNELARNRHNDRLKLLQPDPQVISRRLLTRAQTRPDRCRLGLGLDSDSKEAQCDYLKANTLNVLAAFWIQFMTHDWFSHLEEGHNAAEMVKTGCETELVDGSPQHLTSDEVSKLGCRPDDRVDNTYLADTADPGTFQVGTKSFLDRAYKTTKNNVTAWWDASQLYGYDEASQKRVKRDPKDRAKFLLEPANSNNQPGYLPIFAQQDPVNPAWAGQEATAFPDNWNIGLSFFHNVFVREHNAFVGTFRNQAASTPDSDSGLRDPDHAEAIIRYKDVDDNLLFEVARLVVSAEIAKIHTIEWTTQLLYNDPLYRGMNANWSGLLGGDQGLTSLLKPIVGKLGESSSTRQSNQWYSVFASGPGIFGLGNTDYKHDSVWDMFDRKRDTWDIRNPDDVNGGTNHFGSPFNFPEEFVTVYRLHPMVPDLIEFRDLYADPNRIQRKVPVVDTFRGLATAQMRSGGLANWGLSMGRQRVGALSLFNHPQFLQNLPMPRLNSKTNLLDVAALDILRDRERGVPRFNEFRRQLGLKQFTSFDDFVGLPAAAGSSERVQQETTLRTMREVYGQHKCDASKIITDAQLNDDGSPINDCLNHPDGGMVDNVEDVDTVVGFLAESTRPYGFAISETQFQVFILNASRRLFSDRFFTSSFRPEFYSTLGVRWVNDNGPEGKVMERGAPNGHKQEVSPLKRVLLRTIPELAPELEQVVNVFDPWARSRGEYYSQEWKPHQGAESDEAFQQ
jgi:heme peroxidase